MDIFSKIKKFEEADYFNQNLSNVLIDEDRDKFTIGHFQMYCLIQAVIYLLTVLY